MSHYMRQTLCFHCPFSKLVAVQAESSSNSASRDALLSAQSDSIFSILLAGCPFFSSSFNRNTLPVVSVSKYVCSCLRVDISILVMGDASDMIEYD